MVSGTIGRMGKSIHDCKMFLLKRGDHAGKNATFMVISLAAVGDADHGLGNTGLEAPGSLKLKRAGSETTRTLAVLDFEGGELPF